MGGLPSLSSGFQNQTTAFTTRHPATPQTNTWNLILGPVTFQDLEHPTSLPIPLNQQVAVHQQAGGTRTVQTFGVQPGPIAWKGTLFFGQAVARMGLLRQIVAAGKAVTLKWGPLQWQVVVSKFTADIHHQYEIDYDITCEVVQDNSGQALSAAAASVDQTNASLWDQAQSRWQFLQALDSTTLSGWSPGMSAANNALQNASPVASATQQQVQQAITKVQGIISTVNTYVTPLLPLKDQYSLQKLYYAQGVLSNLNVILANLNTGNPTKSDFVLAASLIDLATTHYGDPSLWYVIAAANNLWSYNPLVNSGSTLKIPPKPVQNTATPQAYTNT